MTFAVMGLGTVLNALTNRRDPTSGLASPIVKAVGISMITVALVFLATELPRLQGALMTTPLTGPQWLAVIGLAMLLPLVVESGKWIRRRRMQRSGPLDATRLVAPERAVGEACGVRTLSTPF